MKIVSADNFGSDCVDEEFLIIFSVDQKTAIIICDALNRYVGESSTIFFKVVSDDYELIGGFEP